jgi:ribulose kinase
MKEYLFGVVTDYVRNELARQSSRNIKAIERAVDLNNPEDYLNELAEILRNTSDLIGIEQKRIKVSKCGIKLSLTSTEAANDITFNELTLGGKNIGVIDLVVFPRKDMLKEATFP